MHFQVLFDGCEVGLGVFIFKSRENVRYKTVYQKENTPQAFVQENWLNSIHTCSANRGPGALKHWQNRKCLQQKLVRVSNVAEVSLCLCQTLQKLRSPGWQPPSQDSSGSWQWGQIWLPIYQCFHPLYVLLPHSIGQQSRLLLALHSSQIFILLLPILWQDRPGPAQVTRDRGNVYNLSYFLLLAPALMSGCFHQIDKTKGTFSLSSPQKC